MSPILCIYYWHDRFVSYIDKPPEITNHPKSLKEVTPGKTVEFTIQATGTKPLSYLWKWKPAVRENGSKDWQPCDSERFSGAESSLLTILDVQKWNEGSYCCVIHNYAGNRTSKPATITVGKNTNTHSPRITTHPQSIDNAVPGKPASHSKASKDAVPDTPASLSTRVKTKSEVSWSPSLWLWEQ